MTDIKPTASYEATEYCPKGLFALLTPQANTTAEMEMAILLPQGYGMATARLVSRKPDMSARLIDYVAQQNATLDQFANAPVSAAMFACTGAAYLIDPKEEKSSVAAIEAARGYPFVTAADAIADAVAALGAERMCLISPYGDDLHDAALAYWKKRGLNPVSVERIAGRSAAFHPIYATPSSKAEEAFQRVSQQAPDCVLFLGTGLPTLPVIASRGQDMDILSPNVCLMWRAWMAATGQETTAGSLRGFLGPNALWHRACRLRTGDEAR